MKSYPIVSILAPADDDPDARDVVATASGLAPWQVREFFVAVAEHLIALKVDPSSLTYNVSGEVTCGGANVAESAAYHAERIAPVLRGERSAA